jgi:hypothetical protein
MPIKNTVGDMIEKKRSKLFYVLESLLKTNEKIEQIGKWKRTD